MRFHSQMLVAESYDTEFWKRVFWDNTIIIKKSQLCKEQIRHRSLGASDNLAKAIY